MSHTVKKYLLGFILCVLLTFMAYDSVVSQLIPVNALIFVIITLGVIQAIVQLIFFLDLDEENKPRWNLTAVVSTIGLILIVILGSLWIMSNLNYHLPSDSEILKSENIFK